MTLDFRVHQASEAEALIAWLSSEPWPFHGQPNPTPAQVRGRIEREEFTGEDVLTVWITDGAQDRVGLLVIQELTDPTPIFDLRVRAAHRRRGVARAALAWLARHVFDEVGKHRVEGHTRVDNLAMRGVFEASGWVQEAYYRQAWPDPGGRWHDAVTYALLASDWRSGTRTPVPAFGGPPDAPAWQRV